MYQIGPSELFSARSHLMIDINAVASLVQKVANVFANYSGAVVSNETLMKDVRELVEFENETFAVFIEIPRYYETLNLHLRILTLQLIGENQTIDWHPVDMTVGEFVEWYRNNMTDFNEDPVSRVSNFIPITRSIVTEHFRKCP